MSLFPNGRRGIPTENLIVVGVVVLIIVVVVALVALAIWVPESREIGPTIGTISTIILLAIPTLLGFQQAAEAKAKAAMAAENAERSVNHVQQLEVKVDGRLEELLETTRSSAAALATVEAQDTARKLADENAQAMSAASVKSAADIAAALRTQPPAPKEE